MVDIERRRQRQRKYYAERRNAQKCVTCGKQDDRTLGGHVYCIECEKKRYKPYDPSKRTEARRNAENADKREWANMLHAKHLCVNCGRKDKRTIDGKRQCLFCATKINNRAKERRKTDGDRLRAITKARRDNWKQHGLCSFCGHELDDPKYRMCTDCRVRARLNHKRRSREAGIRPRGEDGRCYQCNKNKRMDGKKLCEACYAAKIETIRKSGFMHDKGDK